MSENSNKKCQSFKYINYFKIHYSNLKNTKSNNHYYNNHYFQSKGNAYSKASTDQEKYVYEPKLYMLCI